MLRKRICFISETGRSERPLLDPSVRYRAFHPAEILTRSGHICSIYSAAQFYSNPCFDFEIYIFHRPNIARKLFSHVFNTLKKLGKCLIADYDDLIFGSEDIALISSAVKNNTLTSDAAISAYQSNLEALRFFDKVTTSTAELTRMVKEFHPHATVSVVENIIPPSILEFHQKNLTHKNQRDKNIIGYFAGTKSHDKDFPVVEEVLHRVMSENSNYQLIIIGPVKIPNSIASLENVTIAPAVNYFRLPGLMSMCSTVIAPLEDSIFNSCKSRVKFLESALSGCRLVATPIPDMRAIGSNHISLADNQDQWYKFLSTPLNSNEQENLADKNFNYLKTNCHINELSNIMELKCES